MGIVRLGQSPLIPKFEGEKMRITLESDYALRILTELAEHDDVVDANALSVERVRIQKLPQPEE